MNTFNLEKITRGTIVAIGGGEIGRKKKLPDGSVKIYPIETLRIDQEIVQLSGKENPKLLFIGTASDDSPAYIDAVREHFGQTLGCIIDTLNLIAEDVPDSVIAEKIKSADIIYVGGGPNMTHMLVLWREKGLNHLLAEALDRGCILSGLSAGACCWFEWVDNMDDIDNLKDIDLIPCLGFLKGIMVPHYDKLSSEDKSAIDRLLREKGKSGYGIEEGCALIFTPNGSYSLSSKEGATVHPIPVGA